MNFRLSLQTRENTRGLEARAFKLDFKGNNTNYTFSLNVLHVKKPRYMF